MHDYSKQSFPLISVFCYTPNYFCRLLCTDGKSTIIFHKAKVFMRGMCALGSKVALLAHEWLSETQLRRDHGRDPVNVTSRMRTMLTSLIFVMALHSY